jgi:hypothetical protein
MIANGTNGQAGLMARLATWWQGETAISTPPLLPEFGRGTGKTATITPCASPEPALNLEVAEVLSPSQTNTFLDCNARWYFKYFRGLPDVTDARRAMGRAVHHALAENFRLKIQSGQDLEREEFLGIYAEGWKTEAASARFAPDDDPEELALTGSVLAQKYLVEKAPAITPVAVERKVTGLIGGVKVQGYVDLLNSNGRIVDIKTSIKKPPGIRPDYARQVATYARLTPGASGQVGIDTLIQTRGRDGRPTKSAPEIHSSAYRVTDADLRHIDVIYPLAQEAMRSGLYTPNRGSMFCSRSSCAYWAECEREFGGTVEE